MGDLTPEEVANEMLRCKLKVQEDMDNVKAIQRDFSARLDNFESISLALKSDVKKAELQRISMNDELKSDIKEIKEMVGEHTADEMLTIRKMSKSLEDISTSLKTIKEETEGNTNFIEDFKKKWVKYTTIITTISATLGGIYWVYTLLQKNGFVFVIERVGG